MQLILEQVFFVWATKRLLASLGREAPLPAPGGGLDDPEFRPTSPCCKAERHFLLRRFFLFHLDEDRKISVVILRDFFLIEGAEVLFPPLNVFSLFRFLPPLDVSRRY